jgi:hypothetical protein
MDEQRQWHRWFGLCSPQTSTFPHQLFAKYAQEGFAVPFTYEQALQEAREEILRETPAEKLLERVPVEKRVEGMSGEELLRVLSPQTQEELRRLLQAGPPPASSEGDNG